MKTKKRVKKTSKTDALVLKGLARLDACKLATDAVRERGARAVYDAAIKPDIPGGSDERRWLLWLAGALIDFDLIEPPTRAPDDACNVVSCVRCIREEYLHFYFPFPVLLDGLRLASLKKKSAV